MNLMKAILHRLGLVKIRAGVIFLGLSNSGKTTIVYNLTQESLQMVAPTVGYSIEQVELEGIKIKIMDMSGQNKYQNLWEHYYEECKAVVFVIDAASPEAFAEANTCLQEVLQAPLIKDRPLLVFCNKMDLSTAIPIAELAAYFALPAERARPFQIQPCSALRGEGIQDGFRWLLQQVKKIS